MKNSCKDCVFREDDGRGSQIGCRVGRLDRYRELGLVVAEGDHYAVRDRLCGFNVNRNAVPDDADLGELGVRVANALRVRARWVVACGRRVADPEALARLALSGLDQGDFVRELRVVVRDRKTQRKVSALLAEAAPPVPWGVRWVVDPGRADDPFECVREGLADDPTDCQFFAVVCAAPSERPPPDLLAALDARVNGALDQVPYEDYPWGAVASVRVFEAVGHSPDHPFPARLEEALRAPPEAEAETGGGTP